MKTPGTLYLGNHQYFPVQQKLLDASGLELQLRPQSLQVLHLLAARAGEVVSKQEIFDTVWKDVSVTDDSLVQCIADIRRVLGDSQYKILVTVPRRGYKLMASRAPDSRPNTWRQRWWQSLSSPAAGFVGVLGMALLGVFAFTVWFAPANHPTVQPVRYQAPAANTLQYTPTLSVALSKSGKPDPDGRLDALLQELRVVLNRYRNIQLTEQTPTDYQLLLDGHVFGSKTALEQVTLELKESRDASTIFAESYGLTDDDNAVHTLAVRIAAAVASPGVGAIGRNLLANSRLKPVEELTPAECYAYGYGCTKCSGEEDNIDYRAKACLANMLEKNPEDAKAWALQATLYAHQYEFGSTLSEPARSNLKLRKHLPALAVEAANKAEALSSGNDSAIYWGMAQAYYVSCQTDKLQAAVERGLAINPDDPNLLAAFGDWLAFSGRWTEGNRLSQQAFEIEPARNKKWWWMGIAKAHYARNEDQQAYEILMKSFNERNWLSHLQLAYTLPYLGRVDEAKLAVANLQKLQPGFTIENALEFYRVFCFDDNYLQKIKKALVVAGLPSRGDSTDLQDIRVPVAKTIPVNGINIEYMDVGEGEPVLFVHGSISDYRTWSHYLLPISEKHRYISYSQRYFGTQPWTDNGEKWSVDTQAADLTGFVEALGIGPVHLVSWSSGGRMAHVALVNRPDLFKSATHYEPVSDSILADDPSVKTALDKWRSLWGPFSAALKQKDTMRASELMIENVFELEPGGFAQETELTKELVHHNARTLPLRFGPDNAKGTQVTCDYLKQVKTPTQVILGEKTHEYWSLMMHKFADCTPGAELRILPGTNHKGPISKAQEFSKVILDFVEANK